MKDKIEVMRGHLNSLEVRISNERWDDAECELISLCKLADALGEEIQEARVQEEDDGSEESEEE